jgi:hypothetical protein
MATGTQIKDLNTVVGANATDYIPAIRDKTGANTPIGLTAQQIADLTPSNYGDENAQDAAAALFDDTGDIDFTYDDTTPRMAASIKNDAVTYAKMQAVTAASRVLGRTSSSAGDVQELTVGQGIIIDGTEIKYERAIYVQSTEPVGAADGSIWFQIP